MACTACPTTANSDAVAQQPAADATYTVIDLGTGHTATDLNEVGQAAGSQSKSNPFRPTPLPTDVAIYDVLSRKWSALDVAQVYPRGTRQGVYADLYRSTGINVLGVVVGMKSRYGLYGSSSIMSVPGSKAVTFLPIPGGGEARAINNFNQVVGRTGVIDGVYTAYVYDVVSDTLLDLGMLAGGTYSVASIATNRIRGRAPLRIKFDGTASSDPDGTISQYAWDFGDGGTSDLGQVKHMYTTAGIYTATLTVIDNGGLSSSASITMTVR